MIWLRQTLTISSMFLRRYALKPANLVHMLVLPLIVALIFGAADERALSRMPVGVFVVSASPASNALVHAIDQEPGVDVQKYASQDDLLRAVQKADVAAGVVVDDSGKQVQIIGDPGDAIFAAAQAVVASVAARGGTSLTTAAKAVKVSEVATTKKARATGRPRAAAGMLVYFVFANACIAGSLLIEDRARGVLHRTASGPVSASVIVTGEVLGRFLLAFIEGLLIAVFASVLFGATWGGVLPFGFVLAALAAVAAGASVLLGVLIKRPGPEAATLSIAIAAGAALIGGCFWSLAWVPTAMRTIAYLTPDAWLLRAMDSLAARGAALSAILLDLLVVAGFASAFLGLAVVLLRRATLADGAA